MKYLLVLTVVFLSGCVSNIERPELDSMIDVCTNHGGVLKIDTVLKVKVKCMDGHWANAVYKPQPQ